jgi:hypothetical protein
MSNKRIETLLPTLLAWPLRQYLLQTGDLPTATPVVDLAAEASRSQEYAIFLVIGAIGIVLIIVLGVLIRQRSGR